MADISEQRERAGGRELDTEHRTAVAKTDPADPGRTIGRPLRIQLCEHRPQGGRAACASGVPGNSQLCSAQRNSRARSRPGIPEGNQ